MVFAEQEDEEEEDPTGSVSELAPLPRGLLPATMNSEPPALEEIQTQP